MEKRKHIFWELTLLVGSVFVFRCLWILMDKIPFFNTTKNLLLFLVIGMIMVAWGFYKIIHSDNGLIKGH